MKALTVALVHLKNKKHFGTHCILFPFAKEWSNLNWVPWRLLEDPKGDHSTHGRPTKGNISVEKCSDFSRDELPFKSCCTFPSVTGAFHLRNPKRGKDVIGLKMHPLRKDKQSALFFFTKQWLYYQWERCFVIDNFHKVSMRFIGACNFGKRCFLY